MRGPIGRPLQLKEDVDHIDRNGLNNTRENLRVATRSQNMANAKLRSDNTSGYRGVQWNKQKQKWHALLRVDGKVLHLGFYVNKSDAINAHRAKFNQIFGDFALNE